MEHALQIVATVFVVLGSLKIETPRFHFGWAGIALWMATLIF